MQQVAKLPDDLCKSKDPLKELAIRLNINGPQEIYWHKEVSLGRCIHPYIAYKTKYDIWPNFTPCKCDFCKENP